MLLAYFLLGFVVDELVYDGDELIHKTITTGHHWYSFYLLAAVWAFWLELQAFFNAVLAVQLRAKRAHHRAVHMAETHMAS